MLFSTCEIRKNRRRGVRAFLMGVNQIALMRLLQNLNDILKINNSLLKCEDCVTKHSI